VIGNYATLQSAFLDGKALYTNSSLTTLYTADNKWFQDGASNVFNLGNDGAMSQFGLCPSLTPTPTRTASPTPTRSATMTPTPTRSVTPSTSPPLIIGCTLYDVVIEQADLDDATGNTDPGKNNGTLYVDYTACDGTPTTGQFSFASTFSICVQEFSISPTIYYFNNNTQTAPFGGSSVSDTAVSCDPVS